MNDYYCLSKRDIHPFAAMTSTLEDVLENAVCEIELHDLKRFVVGLDLSCRRGGSEEGETTLGDGERHDGGCRQVLI